MGEKTSNDILSESTQQICTPKVRYTPTRKGLYQSCIRNWEISNFGFSANFVILFLGHLTWESMGNYKTCDISKIAGHRVKLDQNLGLRGNCIVYTVDPLLKDTL